MDASEAEMHRVVAGATLAQLREQRGWTQGQLAEKIHVTQATVSRIEHGQLEPDMAQLRGIAEAFGMKAPELMQLFDDAYAKAMEQANAAGSTGGWKKALAVVGGAGLAGLAVFAAALVIKDRANKPKKKGDDEKTAETKATRGK